jgi:hypothetical protein
MGRVDDKFVFLEPEAFRTPLNLASVIFNREIDRGFLSLIHTIEPSVFKVHFEEHPLSGIGDPAVVQSLISCQAESFYVDDADDTITLWSVLSRQLVPAVEVNNRPVDLRSRAKRRDCPR